MTRRNLAIGILGAALVGGGAGVTTALIQDDSPPAAQFAELHDPNAPPILSQSQDTPVPSRSLASAAASPELIQTPLPSSTLNPSPTNASSPSTSPSTATATPSRASSSTAPAGLLERTASQADSSGWAVAERAGFPIRAKLPPGYWATYTVRNLLDGGGQAFEIQISNRDPLGPPAGSEGDGPPPGSASVSITWYPGTGVIEFGDVPGKLLEQLAVKSSTGLGASFERWDHALENGQHRDLVWIRGQNLVTGGGYVHVSGLVGDSANEAAVAAVIGAVRSLEVVK